MHFQSRYTNEETRPSKVFELIVIAQDVADVLAKKALDALAELLHAIDVVLIDLPIRAGTRTERRDLLIYLIVPRNIGDEILQDRERLHGEDFDRLIQWQRVPPGLTHQPRAAIHFGRARAALRGFAIPAHCQIGREVSLNIVDGVEHNHSRGHGNAILLGFPALTVSSEDF